MADDLCLAFFCLGGEREEKTKKLLSTEFQLVAKLVSEGLSALI